VYNTGKINSTIHRRKSVTQSTTISKNKTRTLNIQLRITRILISIYSTLTIKKLEINTASLGISGARICSSYEKERKAPKVKLRPRRRWEDNIKMDFQEVGCGGMDWIKLAQDRDKWWTLVA
jgi:hypothetical protein